MHDLLAYSFSPFIRPVHQLHPVRHWHTRRIAEKWISSGHVQGPGSYLHTRSRDHAILNCFFYVHVGIPRPLSLQISNGSEAVLQCTPRIHCREDCPIFGRLLQQLLVIIGRCNVALQE